MEYSRRNGARTSSAYSRSSYSRSSTSRYGRPSKRAGFRGGDPAKVEKLLAGAFKKLGIAKDIQRYRFVLHWEEIVGPELAAVCKPECLVGRALIVRVLNSSWAQELSLQSDRILEPLRRFLARDKINAAEAKKKGAGEEQPEIEELRFFSGDLS